MLCPVPGVYRFAIDCRDAGFLFVDGDMAASWPGEHSAGHWQAARPRSDFSLVGCTVGPGFDFEDFRFVSNLRDHKAAFEGALSDYASLL